MRGPLWRVAALAVVLAASIGVIAASSGPSGADTLTFSATFDNPGDFATLFDHGYSGQDSWRFSDGIASYQADHGLTGTDCNGPDTSRTINLSGSGNPPSLENLFYWCGPPNVANGHLMTAVRTVGYNIAWFSPKPTFTNITKVCFDVNETDLGGRKWIDLMFVGGSDITAHPAGVTTNGGWNTTRGSGGFDIGYTDPDFRDPNGPDVGFQPTAGTLAGLKLLRWGPSWFQNQNTFVSSAGTSIVGVTDKATRYTQCLANNADGTTMTFTQGTPSGTRNFTLTGRIPQDARRVVFNDDNYNGPKDPTDTADLNTWHWDNIQVFTAATPPPTTTTVAATTTAPTTSAPTTTVPSTTTIPPTTTTVPDPCAAFTDPGQHAWCSSVEVRLTALGG